MPILYFLWPRNLAALELIQASALSAAKLETNAARLADARRRLREINSDPANLSAVAFVAVRLQEARLDMPPLRQGLKLSDDEWLEVDRARIVTLGRASPDRLAALSDRPRERILAVRKRLIDEANAAYAELSRERREVQVEAERLESERQGLLAMHGELEQRLRRLGDVTFGRFIASLFGF